MAQTTLSVRLDSMDKHCFEEFCKAAGLNISTAINMFVKAVIKKQRIPFEITGNLSAPSKERPRMLTENGMSPDEEAEILKAYEEAQADIERGDYEVWHPGTFTKSSTQSASKSSSKKRRAPSEKLSMKPSRKSSATHSKVPV